MKKVILLTTASLLTIEAAYATPRGNQYGDENLITVSLRSTRVPHTESEKDFSEKFTYQWQLKANRTLDKSVRRTAEETPYVDLRSWLQSNPAMLEGRQYSVKFSEVDLRQILDLYRTGKLQLSWAQNGLNYQQYCVHPLDGFHTLAVKPSRDGDTTYFKQQRWKGAIGSSPVIDVFADSKSQLEYRFDPKSQKWIVEGKKGTSKFSTRKAAVQALEKLSFKYQLKDRTRGEYSSDPFYSFTDPATRWEIDEVENAKYAAYRPPLWKTLSMGWLTLTSGGLIQALRYGLTAPFSQQAQPEEANHLDHSNTFYNMLSLASLMTRGASYAITPLLLSTLSSSKSGLRSPLGTLSTFGLGSLGSAVAQHMWDNQPQEEGYVPPMGTPFYIGVGDSLLTHLSPSIATLTNGETIFVWNAPYGDFALIHGCVIQGERCDNPFSLETVSPCYPDFGSYPVVASLPNGNAIVLWTAAAYENNICESIINSGGSVTSSQSLAENGSGIVSVASLSNGNALTIWTSDGYTYGRHINSQGNPIEQSPFTINSGISSIVTALKNGNAFVTSLTSSSFLNGYILNGSQVQSTVNLQMTGLYPASVSTNDGTAVFVVCVNNNNAIYGTLVSQTGDILEKPFLIGENVIAKSNVFPSVSSLLDGNLFTTWMIQGGGIYGKVTTPQGTNITAPFQISNGTYEVGSNVALLNDGNILTTWTDWTNPENLGLYGRVVYMNQIDNK